MATDEVVRMLDATDLTDLAARRNRALLLIGYAVALRRSELVAIDVDHLDERRDGLVVTLPRSKTDQEGAGRQIGIAHGDHPTTCPDTAFRTWLLAAAIVKGAVFRSIDRHGNLGGRLSPASVNRVYKTMALAAGLDPKRVSGHSVRAGHATAAAANGAPDRTMMTTTGHRDRRTLDGYVQAGQILDDTSSTYLDL